MQIVFHCGVHTTDNGRISQLLDRNEDRLRADHTELVPPARHRGLFRNPLQSLSGGTATKEMEDVLLDAILQNDHTERAILSTPGLLGVPSAATGKDGIYPSMGYRLSSLANLFPSCDAEFFIAIRNPATMLSDLAQGMSERNRQSLLSACQYFELRWNETIRRLAQSAQGRRVVIWCDEDTPLILPEIVRLLGHISPEIPLKGDQDFLKELLTPQGQELLAADNTAQEPSAIEERRNLYSHLLRKHAAEDALEQRIELPGWTQDIVDEVTELYYHDIEEIAELPGVEFVSP